MTSSVSMPASIVKGDETGSVVGDIHGVKIVRSRVAAGNACLMHSSRGRPFAGNQIGLFRVYAPDERRRFVVLRARVASSTIFASRPMQRTIFQSLDRVRRILRGKVVPHVCYISKCFIFTLDQRPLLMHARREG